MARARLCVTARLAVAGHEAIKHQLKEHPMVRLECEPLHSLGRVCEPFG